MTSRIAIAAPLVFSLLASIAGAADWPQWRGPQRDGTSPETGLLDQWPAAGPRLVWQVNDIGAGYSTPVVAGGRLYVLGNEGAENEYVKALSAADGSTLWTTRIGNVGHPEQEPDYSGSRSTPVVDGDVLYAFGSNGDIACLETASGNIRWTKNVRTDFGGVYGEWAYAESPLVDGDVVVCAPGGAEATILAFNKRSGDVVWRTQLPTGGDDASYASPIIVNAAGRKQYVYFLANSIVGVDPADGSTLWQYKTGETPANSFTPIGNGNFVYSASGSNAVLLELQTEGDGVSVRETYLERGLPVSRGGSVLVDGHVYGATGQALVCADFRTGEIKWQDSTIEAGAVCYADGKIYVHSDDNVLAVIAATPEAYRELGRLELPNQPIRPRGTQEKAWAYPILADGKLYARDGTTMWCYDVAE